MLTGVPPFPGQDDEEILAKVKKGKYNEQTLVDAGCSQGAIKFISNLIQLDPTKRLSAKEAMKDEWIKEYIEQAKNET